MFFICDRLLWDASNGKLRDPQGNRTIEEVYEIQTIGLSTKWSPFYGGLIEIEAAQSPIPDFHCRLYISMTESHGLIIGPVYT